MPKPKRRKNLFGFGGKKSSGNYIPASGGIAAHSAKRRASKASAGVSDSKLDDVAKSLAKGKKYASLSSSEQAMVRRVASKMNPKRKRNTSIGLPKNQFVNAKVRVKGGKVQVMADEKLLGKAGFKTGAGLSGVSVSGGAKVNPTTATIRHAKKAYVDGAGKPPRSQWVLAWRTPPMAASSFRYFDTKAEAVAAKRRIA